MITCPQGAGRRELRNWVDYSIPFYCTAVIQDALVLELISCKRSKVEREWSRGNYLE